ncbi:hypothetical protein NliqN6_5022 [Naganishia liquefaciens]|uniref:PXA domain-containing protein n=1 Tax=Naganishia liquefaciens TaxID=104408 RepID=A0A8H3TXG2_9TREE|nr:hypothetical protein NliqN6_5022 [Naganishia liquefaciens]
MPDVRRNASADPIQGIDNLRFALRDLVEIVVKLYITSWYTYISPRDQSFVNAARDTIIAFLESIISDLTRQHQARDGTQHSLDDFLFTTAPTIFERHIKAYRRAQEDVDTMQLLEMVAPKHERPGDASEGNGSSERSPSVSILAQQYQLYAPHPGMRIADHPLAGIQGPDPMIPTQTDLVEIRRQPKTRAIDESLADALSSSITALPPRIPGAGSSGTTSGMRNETNSKLEPYGLSPSQSYEPSPEYLSRLADYFIRRHLPPQDYASKAERTMVAEVLGNAVLGNVLRICSEPSFIWRLGLNLFGNEHSTRDVHPRYAPECSKGPDQDTQPPIKPDILIAVQDRTAISIAPYFALFARVLRVITATCIFIVATFATTLLKALQADSQPVDAKVMEEGRSHYLFEPWIEASSALLSAEPAFATRELWMIGKMGYIGSSRRVDNLAKDVFAGVLNLDSAAWAVAKLTGTLFPDGVLAPSIPEPSEEEVEGMRQDLERCLHDRIPTIAKFLLLGTSQTAQQKTIRNALNVFSNPTANANLLLTLVEAILKAAVPLQLDKGQD